MPSLTLPVGGGDGGDCVKLAATVNSQPLLLFWLLHLQSQSVFRATLARGRPIYLSTHQLHGWKTSLAWPTGRPHSHPEMKSLNRFIYGPTPQEKVKKWQTELRKQERQLEREVLNVSHARDGVLSTWDAADHCLPSLSQL